MFSNISYNSTYIRRFLAVPNTHKITNPSYIIKGHMILSQTHAILYNHTSQFWWDIVLPHLHCVELLVRLHGQKNGFLLLDTYIVIFYKFIPIYMKTYKKRMFSNIQYNTTYIIRFLYQKKTIPHVRNSTQHTKLPFIYIVKKSPVSQTG